PYAAEDTGGTAWLLLEVATLADQKLDVLVNDETIARVRLEVVGVGETELVRLPFDAGLLSVEGGNRITIGLLRGAEAAFSQGVRLRSVMIEGGGDEARE